jgi:hypothetical protein
LLSRAAPDAVSKDRIGTMFDSETMTPRIAEPPFVAALTELAHKNIEQAPDRVADKRSVPVLGYSDSLAAVTGSTHNAASAFKLLEWLAQAETSTQLAQAAEGSMPARRSLLTSSSWYSANLTRGERAEIAEALKAAFSGEQCLLVPRIPGVDEYLAALDQAVHDAVSGGVAPQAALERTARQWDAITDAHGRDAQRAAYLNHLGISDE